MRRHRGAAAGHLSSEFRKPSMTCHRGLPVLPLPPDVLLRVPRRKLMTNITPFELLNQHDETYVLMT